MTAGQFRFNSCGKCATFWQGAVCTGKCTEPENPSYTITDELYRYRAVVRVGDKVESGVAYYDHDRESAFRNLQRWAEDKCNQTKERSGPGSLILVKKEG